jgi:hypothetical protein
MIEQYVDAGLSKFVVRPASVSAGSAGFSGLEEFLEGFAAEMMPLQN